LAPLQHFEVTAKFGNTQLYSFPVWQHTAIFAVQHSGSVKNEGDYLPLRARQGDEVG